MKSELFVLVGKENNDPFISSGNGSTISIPGISQAFTVNVFTLSSAGTPVVVPVFEVTKEEFHHDFARIIPLEEFVSSPYILSINKKYTKKEYADIICLDIEELDSVVLDLAMTSIQYLLDSTSDEDEQEETIANAERLSSKINNLGRTEQINYISNN